MSYIIHEKEIRMLYPKGFHYIYVLTAEKLRKVKLSETEGQHFSSFLTWLVKTKSSVWIIKNEIKVSYSQQCLHLSESVSE